MKRKLTKQVIYLAILAFTLPSCKKAMTNVTDAQPANHHVGLKTASTDFVDTDWKGVCWEPFNSSWGNTGTAQDAADLATGGAKWVRVWFAGNATTVEMDSMVSRCNSKGFKIVACYNKAAPAHALGTTTEQAAEVTTLTNWVNRYKTSIHFWEVHNEPNLQTYWTDTTSTGVQNFVAWLHLAHDAIKSADPTATVILGGVSSYNATMATWMSRFTTYSGYNYIDEVSYHPYETTPDNVIATLNNFRERMNAWPSGKQDLPIWITEFGFHVGSLPNVPAGVADEATKASYLTQAFKKLTQNLSWKRPICWYDVHEKSPGSDYFNLINRATATPLTTMYYQAYYNFQALSSSWTTNQTGDGAPIIHQAEAEVASSSGENVRDFFETAASNGGATAIDASTSGGYMAFRVRNVQPGSYNVTIGVKKGTSRGIFHLYAAPYGTTSGSYIGGTQDLYSTSTTYTTIDLGTWTVSAYGDKTFKFEITGKNAGSTGTFPYTLAIDYIQLYKL